MDFTKVPPKAVFLHTGEQSYSLEDGILLAYLHLLGFDGVLEICSATSPPKVTMVSRSSTTIWLVSGGRIYGKEGDHKWELIWEEQIERQQLRNLSLQSRRLCRYTPYRFGKYPESAANPAAPEACPAYIPAFPPADTHKDRPCAILGSSPILWRMGFFWPIFICWDLM